MKIELLTQKNCPKCEWFKEYILPALKLKGFEIIETNIENYNISFLIYNKVYLYPTLLIWNDNDELFVLDKGLTLKNVENKIREHCE